MLYILSHFVIVTHIPLMPTILTRMKKKHYECFANTCAMVDRVIKVDGITLKPLGFLMKVVKS
jgi:hypothetical protein